MRIRPLLGTPLCYVRSMRRPARAATKLPIFAAGGAVAAALLGDSMLYAVMPSTPQAWGLSAGVLIGVLLSANRIVRLASNPLAAMVFNRFGSRAPFAVAMAMAVVVTATYGWTTAFWLLLLARIAWGVCWSVLRLGGFWAVLDAATDENRGLLMGTYSSVARLGGIVGAIAGGTLTDAVGHRSTLTLFAALTAVGGVAWYVATRSTAPHSRPLMAARGEAGGLAAVLGDRKLLAVSAGGLVTGLVFAGLVSASLGSYLRAHYGEEVPVAGAVIGVASLTGIMLGMRGGRRGAGADGPVAPRGIRTRRGWDGRGPSDCQQPTWEVQLASAQGFAGYAVAIGVDEIGVAGEVGLEDRLRLFPASEAGAVVEVLPVRA